MKETLATKISNASSLTDVLLILKEKTLMDTHVSTLAYVDELTQEKTESNKYGIVKCKPFPLNVEQEEFSIYAYYFKADSTAYLKEKNNIVLVLFTDLNFISNLNSINNKPKETSDLIYHSLKYGIIIDTM